MNPEVKWIMEHLDNSEMLPEMDEALHLAFHWAHDDHGYASKNARIQEYRDNARSLPRMDHYEVFCHIFIGALLHPQGMTYQAMIGYIAGNIGCEDPLDRAKCAAELIALAYQADLIVITKSGDSFLITTEFELPVEIPEFVKHRPEYKPPAPLDVNRILGNRFKQHDLDTCLDHLERMNAIPLTLEHRLIAELPETPSSEPETDEQAEQWEDFRRRSQEAYAEAIQHQRFWLKHNYDTRGRTYCKGYYINYQGASYKKAIVQLAEKEVVKL